MAIMIHFVSKLFSRMIPVGSIAFLALSVSAHAKDAPKTWNQKMRELRQVLVELMPDVASDARFNDPKNAKRIEANAAKLARLSHDLSADYGKGLPAAPADGDLSIPMIAKLFQDEAKNAHLAFKSGHKKYAQGVLSQVPGFCLGCHTRHGAVADLSFTDLGSKPSFTRKVDEARFQAATRQFDASLSTFEKILVGGPNSADVGNLDWERAARQALSIAVRVKGDPEAAGRIVDRILESPKPAGFLKSQAAAWKTAIGEWKNEMGRKTTSEEGAFSEVKRLSTRAYGRQSYPLDKSGAVDYLRSSRAAHDFLRAYPSSPHAPEALFLLGVAYEALQDLELWTLHELYFEACVWKAPHTDIARACFNRYEESVNAGYTGSGGTDLPAEIERKLVALRALSRAASDLKSDGAPR